METEWAVLGRFLCRRKKNSYRLGQVQTPQAKRIEKTKKNALWKSELSMLDQKQGNNVLYTLQGINISPQKWHFEDDFPFPKVGYVNPLEGKQYPPAKFTSVAFLLRWLISGLFEKIKSTRPGWWQLKHVFMFIPKNWGNDPIWLIFRWGLQPPTSRVSKKGHDLNHLACFFSLSNDISGSGAFVRGNPGLGGMNSLLCLNWAMKKKTGLSRV